MGKKLQKSFSQIENREIIGWNITPLKEELLYTPLNYYFLLLTSYFLLIIETCCLPKYLHESARWLRLINWQQIGLLIVQIVFLREQELYWSQ